MGEADEVERLRRENASLCRAMHLMHEIADLARESLELEGVGYAVLTGVTAGIGLGLNRAMLFVTDPQDRASPVGMAAVGPNDREEPDRVWKSIERDSPDLRKLCESGQELRRQPKPLDARVRELRVSLEGDTPIALALRDDAVVCGCGSDDLVGLLRRRAAIAAPLRGPQRRVGVLYADNAFTEQALDEVTQSVFGMVAGHAGRAVENARSYEQVLRVSQTDSPVGLGHHGALRDALGRSVDQARGDDLPLSVVMLDLDDFKGINDTLGHLAGDRLLAEIARRLRRVVRGRPSIATAARSSRRCCLVSIGPGRGRSGSAYDRRCARRRSRPARERRAW